MIFRCTFAQVSLNYSNSIELIERNFKSDTISNNLLLLPLLNLNFEFNSNPALSNFINLKKNTISINLNDYYNSSKEFVNHISRFNLLIFNFSKRKSDKIYSFGSEIVSFSEASVDRRLIKLISDGNYQYLNQNLSFGSENFFRSQNYVSLFFGYSQNLMSDFYCSAKINLIKGIYDTGLNISEFNLLSETNLDSNLNPYLINFNTQSNYHNSRGINLFSNLGMSVDLEINYDFRPNLDFYLKVEDFGYIKWEEYNYRIDGDFEFSGVDFNLEENLGIEFSNLVDSIFDGFSSKQFTTIKYRFNPYVINLGAVYNFQNLNDNFNFDFELQKLKKGFLVTYSLQYYKYFPAQKIVISPTYRLNKFSYTNLSLLIYKRWHNNFLSSIYFGNLLSPVVNLQSNSIVLGCGFGILF
ncbi:MAG: DUF5723 family protein [Bacteroidota bacterium]|nr:DUF5723 family protein [Bacteroidota bacterium]